MMGRGRAWCVDPEWKALRVRRTEIDINPGRGLAAYRGIGYAVGEDFVVHSNAVARDSRKDAWGERIAWRIDQREGKRIACGFLTMRGAVAHARFLHLHPVLVSASNFVPDIWSGQISDAVQSPNLLRELVK